MRRRRLSGQPPKRLPFDLGQMLPGQAEFWGHLDAGKKRVAVVTGIRGGKTLIGSKRAVVEAGARGGLGWIVAPTYRMANVPMRYVGDVLGQYPQIIAQSREHPHPYWRLNTPNGAEIEVVSAEHPDHLRGPGLSWVWIDEAALVDYEAYRILSGRLIDSGGPLWITTTPRGKNWVYDQFVIQKEGPIVTWGIRDNIFLPADEIEREYQRWGKGSRYAEQELEGKFVAFEGLVYADFDPDYHVVEPPPAEAFQETIGWIDWGFGDPTTLGAMGHTKNNEWWVRDELYEPRLSVTQVVQEAAAFCRQWNIRLVWADPSRPDLIAELRSAGIPILPSRSCKPLTLGVAVVAGMLKGGRLKVAPHCRHTITEFGLYAFKRVPGTDRTKGGEVPDDKFNHCLDGIRYVAWSQEPVIHDTVSSDGDDLVRRVREFREPGEPKDTLTEDRQIGY